jgi:hypothetical protein
VTSRYAHECDLRPGVYLCRPSDGASVESVPNATATRRAARRGRR